MPKKKSYKIERSNMNKRNKINTKSKYRYSKRKTNKNLRKRRRKTYKKQSGGSASRRDGGVAHAMRVSLSGAAADPSSGSNARGDTAEAREQWEKDHAAALDAERRKMAKQDEERRKKDAKKAADDAKKAADDDKKAADDDKKAADDEWDDQLSERVYREVGEIGASVVGDGKSLGKIVNISIVVKTKRGVSKSSQWGHDTRFIYLVALPLVEGETQDHRVYFSKDTVDLHASTESDLQPGEDLFNTQVAGSSPFNGDISGWTYQEDVGGGNRGALRLAGLSGR
jgi:hypothetical protein